jgi:4-hydroxy-3-polyprenylbenzoate decarboxylase
MKHPIVLAITGASGVVYGLRLLEVLLAAGEEVHLTISDSGRLVIKHELEIDLDLAKFSLKQLFPSGLKDVSAGASTSQFVYHQYKDFMTPIASGSFRTRAMVVCPCSGSTLSGIASAASQNLIQRAADVHLKERRPLILVTRETPLSLIQIDNLRTACAAGATILPASPGFYHGCESVGQLVDFVVARILDQVGVEHDLMKRWGGGEEV